ncbi:hypothetical protein JG688_00015985 [Phytophthora aleatoria]|uniref:Uncharacterized protein n=1 Tax=Phytophthora aleatoria TaxID=2496075 RepID=A0A8J5LZ86_9STRA|nr:hypothetical protein JG688_00015985 [Phytophthora aleatoria]
MSLPFGWTGSPAHYGTFGGAISFMVTRESPERDDVDGHILIESDRANRLQLAETALRRGMMAVLGPNAMSENKFSTWQLRIEALGLIWDTERRSVSMPSDKLTKALRRIDEALTCQRISRHQELNRVLSCAELQFKLHVSTAHLQGSSNYLADLGSMAWSRAEAEQWSNLVCLWFKQVVPTEYRKIYKQESPIYNGGPWLTHRDNSTSVRGNNGVDTAQGKVSRIGSPQTIPSDNPYNLLCSRLNAGKPSRTTHPAELIPCELNSDGGISSSPDSDRLSHLNTNLSYKECVDSARHDSSVPPCQPQCSPSSPKQPTCRSPSTASYVGLRCWASSFA